MSLTLFAALSVPDDVADRLMTLRGDFPGALWRSRGHLHLTLAYFGGVSFKDARDLDEALAELNHAPFEVKLSGVGIFGRSEPNALWAGVETCPALESLAGKVKKAGVRTGLKMENRRYRPHVTLAYCKNMMPGVAARFQETFFEFRTEPFWVEQFELYSSNRTGATSRYDEEATYPLLGT